MHFYVFMNRYGSMTALRILNLCITEDMWMTYLLCFVHQTILKNLLIIWIQNKNIKFTSEKESNNSLPFLDIFISRSENGFKTSVYHKPTFSGVYSNFNSFIYDEYKTGLVFTMLFRTFSIVSDFSRFHTEIILLKEILRKNAVSHKTGWQLH